MTGMSCTTPGTSGFDNAIWNLLLLARSLTLNLYNGIHAKMKVKIILDQDGIVFKN